MLVHSIRNDVDQTPAITAKFKPQDDSDSQETYTYFVPLPSITQLKEHLISDSDEPHSKWKTCEHYKCSSVSGSGTRSVPMSIAAYSNHGTHVAQVETPWAAYDDAYGSAGELNLELPGFYVPNPAGGFVPPPDDLDSLLQNAYKAMLPTIKAELSIVNSLIELKDIVTLRSTIESVDKLIGVLRKRGLNRQTLRDIFREKANVYLQYKFNIAPLLSDINGIYRSLASAEKRMNALVTRSGRVRVSHFTRQLTESAVPIDSPHSEAGFRTLTINGQLGTPIGIVTNLNRTVLTEPASFHVQMRYNYNYTDYQIEHARLVALLDAIGFNFDPSIIWNAIPWSFVVDWIFGVGRYLDSMKVAFADPKINILQCLWSIKRRRRITVSGSMTTTSYYFPPAAFPPTSLVFPTVVESAYCRKPFLPGHSSIESSGLTPTEFSLGAALVISQRRRPKRLRR